MMKRNNYSPKIVNHLIRCFDQLGGQNKLNLDWNQQAALDRQILVSLMSRIGSSYCRKCWKTVCFRIVMILFVDPLTCDLDFTSKIVFFIYVGFLAGLCIIYYVYRKSTPLGYKLRGLRTYYKKERISPIFGRARRSQVLPHLIPLCPEI